MCFSFLFRHENWCASYLLKFWLVLCSSTNYIIKRLKYLACEVSILLVLLPTLVIVYLLHVWGLYWWNVETGMTKLLLILIFVSVVVHFGSVLFGCKLSLVKIWNTACTYAVEWNVHSHSGDYSAPRCWLARQSFLVAINKSSSHSSFFTFSVPASYWFCNMLARMKLAGILFSVFFDNLWVYSC